jgi:hypothetical protein
MWLVIIIIKIIQIYPCLLKLSRKQDTILKIGDFSTKNYDFPPKALLQIFPCKVPSKIMIITSHIQKIIQIYPCYFVLCPQIMNKNITTISSLPLITIWLVPFYTCNNCLKILSVSSFYDHSIKIWNCSDNLFPTLRFSWIV